MSIYIYPNYINNCHTYYKKKHIIKGVILSSHASINDTLAENQAKMVCKYVNTTVMDKHISYEA
jgi:hypothetical protein